MSFSDRWYTFTEIDDPRRPGEKALRRGVNLGARIRDGVILSAVLIAVPIFWPFNTVPTGSRGVVTQFGKIIGIEGEGLALLWPWQRLGNLSMRAAQADIEHAEG